MVLVVTLFLVGMQVAFSLQPRVITVEAHPSRRVFGSLSLPLGSPWCNGRPTYWLVGHQGDDETPWCLVLSVDDANRTDFTDYNYNDAKFERPRRAILDEKDSLNNLDGPKNIDRHSCAAVDVNVDGSPDIVCGVGANRGKGQGYNEVYLKDTNGSVTKKLEGHGFHKHTTIRTRWVEPLTGADGSQLLFVAARGAVRADNKTNTHRMYRIIQDPAKKVSNRSFFFREVQTYSWKRNTKASCLLTNDLNNDGLDDVLICNEERKALMYLQNANNTWTTVPVAGDSSKDWSNAPICALIHHLLSSDNPAKVSLIVFRHCTRLTGLGHFIDNDYDAIPGTLH